MDSAAEAMSLEAWVEKVTGLKKAAGWQTPKSLCFSCRDGEGRHTFREGHVSAPRPSEDGQTKRNEVIKAKNEYA